MNFNRGELALALSQYLGIKGEFAPDFDPTVVSSIPLVDGLHNTPYLRFGIPVARAAQKSAVAGAHSYLVARPGPNVALQITAVTLNNTSGAAIATTLRLLTAANIAACAPGTPTAMLDLASREAGVGSLRSSVIVPAENVSPNIGTSFDKILAAAATKTLMEFPAPGIILYGGDAGGLAVVDDIQNETINCSFYGREWPLPG